MHIQNITTFQINFNPNHNIENNNYNFGINKPCTDTVSFGSKNYTQKQKKQQKGDQRKTSLKININNQTSHNILDIAKQRREQLQQNQKSKTSSTVLSSSETLEQEHKKAKLRKNFLTNDFRETIKNHLISDKKLEIIIERLKEHPDIIEDLFFEPAGGELALKLSDKIFETVLKNTNNYEKLVFSKDGNGKTFIQKAPDSKIIIFNEAAQDMPALLENVYTIADSRGRLPAHYLPPKVLKSMNAVLKNNPRILHTIYTTQDKHGNTPAHNRFYASYKEISKVLKEMPATASKIERLQNKFGENYTHAILQAKQYKGPYKETWNYILNNC